MIHIALPYVITQALLHTHFPKLLSCHCIIHQQAICTNVMGYYDAKWLLDLAFMIDVTQKINHLNLLLQGKETNIWDMISAVKHSVLNSHYTFQKMESKRFALFLHLKDVRKSRRCSWGFQCFQVLQPIVKTLIEACRQIH